MSGIIAMGVVLVVALLIAWTWVRGLKAKAALAAQYPPPGQLVDVQVTQPELIADAIREVVEAVRR